MTQLPPDSPSLRGAVDLSSLVNRPVNGGSGAGRTAAAGTAAPSGPANGGAGGGPVPVPALVLEGTDTNFAQFLELSMAVPVIVDLWADWCQPCKQLTPVLEKLVAEYAGRLVMVTVDVDSNPQLAQAFQAQSIPTVAAIVAGQPVALFAGAYPEQQVREVFEQLLLHAADRQVIGVASVVEGAGGAEPGGNAEPVQAPLPPHHQEAHDAIERGDFDQAIAEFSTAIAQNPNDNLAVAGLAQVKLLARLSGKGLEEIRSAAASAPDDLDSQLLVADLDLAGGHAADAFDRLLTLYPRLDDQGKECVRERLLELFQVAGVDDPRVVAARRRLAMLLY